MYRICLGLTLPLLLTAAGEPAKDWKPYHSKEGGFEVSFPGKPLESRQLVKTGLGTLQVTMLLLEHKKEAAFVVSFTDFSEEAFKGGDDEKRLNFARDGAVASAKGKLKSEKKITLAKFPGRELVIESDTRGTVRTRIYAVEKRLYQTMAVGSKAFVQSKDAERFLNSFQLDKE